MPRRAAFDLAYDSSYFTSAQLHPVSAVRLAFLGWARWAHTHAVAFPKMIRDHHAGFAVIGVRLTYGTPFGFLDGDQLTLTTTSQLLRERTLMETATTIAAEETTLARVVLLTRALSVDPARGMAAAPAALPDTLTDLYQHDEIHDSARFTDELTPRLQKLAGSGPAAAHGSFERLVDRQVCEAADQWCFTEVTGLLGSAREHLIDTQGDQQPVLRQGLARRIASIEFKLQRPLFLCDHVTVTTTAHPIGTTMAFVHHLAGPDGQQRGLGLELLEDLV